MIQKNLESQNFFNFKEILIHISSFGTTGLNNFWSLVQSLFSILQLRITTLLISIYTHGAHWLWIPPDNSEDFSLPMGYRGFVFGIFKKDFIYLFLERGEGREKERDTSMCGCLSCAPCWGLSPRHVPWLGIKLATLCFTGWHSIHWATPARD